MKVDIDENGKPVGVHQKFSKEANWLIEEFMLLANKNVAEFVASGGKMGGKALSNAKTFVYRVHDEPNLEKVTGLREFAGNLGYKMGPIGSGKDIALSLNNLLADAKEKPEPWPRPATAPTTSAITAWRSSSTRISPPRSAAIRT